jgi:ABC-type phosphate transport system auxiliary subunit
LSEGRVIESLSRKFNLTNALLKNDLVVARSKLKYAAKENNENRKQIDNQLDAKHQLRLCLAKIDFKKLKLTLSRELEKSVSATIFIIIA